MCGLVQIPLLWAPGSCWWDMEKTPHFHQSWTLIPSYTLHFPHWTRTLPFATAGSGCWEPLKLGLGGNRAWLLPTREPPCTWTFCLDINWFLFANTGCQVTGTFYACAPPESQAPGIPIEPSIRSAEALALSGECSASFQAPREVASLLRVGWVRI